MKLTTIIEGSSGKPILLKCSVPDTIVHEGVLVMVHGFKGFMDWGHFPQVAAAFLEAGIPVVQFNFSHNGTNPEHPVDFVDLEAFGQNNYSRELYDLGKVLDAVEQLELLTEAGVDTRNITLLGHSRGGGISILKAAKDARVTKLISWAAVYAFGAFFGTDVLEQWKEEGVIYSFNARTQQEMPLYYQLYEDVLNNAANIDILSAAASISKPWQIVHGTNDSTVPFSTAQELAAACGSAELIAVEGGNHTFGGKHPWPEEHLPEQSKDIVAAAISFVKAVS
jgi:pimeloyl-ACP methyl ester carboxylesterase